MLISHKHQFIYTKTVKTAGSSVEAYFEPFCMSEEDYAARKQGELHESPIGIVSYGPDRPKDAIWYNHMPAIEVKRQIGEEVWNRYFKFCVIRDPFDKAVSAYYFFKDRKRNRRAAPRSVLARIRSKLLSTNKGDSPRYAFERWVLEGGMIRDRDKYVINGEICVDEFIRFENLHEDIKGVCQRLGIPFDPSEIPHRKSKTRDKRLGLSQMYTKKSVEAISKLYRFEIEHFGYRPPVVEN